MADLCNDTIHTINTDAEEIQIDNRIKKGVILKFLPKIWIPEFEWKSKFIYPSNLLMDEQEYDSWISQTLTNWQTQYESINETHYFEKIVYWKLESSHNVTIDRDVKFISNILPIINDSWSKVVYYRNNLSKLNELRDIVKKRTKYIKFNTQIHNNNNLVDKKNIIS